jgi:Rrf2 family protein
MLTNACQYAIRAVLFLAIHGSKTKKIGVKTIAEELESPQPFLAKLLQELSRKKLISSTKGPHGGFYLSKADKQNTVWDIIICIDGPDKFNACFLGLPTCGDDNPCPVHFTVSPFKKKMLQKFKDKNIEEFAKEIIENQRYLSLKNINF